MINANLVAALSADQAINGNADRLSGDVPQGMLFALLYIWRELGSRSAGRVRTVRIVREPE